MSTLGDKRSSKRFLADKAPYVPLIPGFAGSSTAADDLEEAANAIGFPIMLKASAGGGGKGMRVVRQPSQLREELARVQSEAARSFGSSDCILEKYIESSKHVEIQIVGDQHGNVISFFERDCSVQRRHQKIVEESPCPSLTDDVRREMGDVAVRIAKLIGYENAGTVEFVVDVDTSQFYFLEVNARLQVEHPITEEMTGTDLVAMQLFVAAGGDMGSLPHLKTLRQVGHAIECRLCTEDPRRDFVPEHGKILLWRPADGILAPGRDVRYETAIRSGSSVSIYFDSMIAKFVVWAPTRNMAIQKMANVLAQTACVGVKTNQLFLQKCLLHPDFQDPRYNTSFVPRNLVQLLHHDRSTTEQSLKWAESIVPSLFVRKLSLYQPTNNGKRPFSNVRSQFRNQRHDPVSVHCDVITGNFLNGPTTAEDATHPRLSLWVPAASASSQGISQVKVALFESEPQDDRPNNGDDATPNPAAKNITRQYNRISKMLRDTPSEFSQGIEVKVLRWTPIIRDAVIATEAPVAATLQVSIQGSKVVAHCVIPQSQSVSPSQSQTIFCHFQHLGTHVETQRNILLSYMEGRRTTMKAQDGQVQNDIKAPMPCKILSIQKKKGDKIKAGDVVLVIESMKMEMSIKASKEGQFDTPWKAGDAVNEGDTLCSIT